jgi:predicted Zn-dependent protease with MMP-like domain
MFRVTPERFDEMVGAALDEIPEQLADAMENVVVTVEEQPSPQQAARTRGLLLGLYEGVPLTRRGPLSYNGATPDRITIFRGSLCALAHDEPDLTARVRVTVLHEVGHYFGMTDERLQEMGWA